jgi:pantothenate kinase
MMQPVLDSFDAAVARARALVADGQRRILGIAGEPGCGKSTLAMNLLQELGDVAVGLPMDSYHLSNEQLILLERRNRKGATDTFDVHGYIEILRRVRSQDVDVIYAPRFHREIEESIAAEIAVHEATPLIISEGNYLLVNDDPWSGVRGQMDEIWYIDIDQGVRHERLIARHLSHGQDMEESKKWTFGSDERNAEVIRATQSRADCIVRFE